MRTPRRSVLTALGIAAAITTLVTVTGFIDTFGGTLDRAETELLHARPDRVSVTLDTFQPLDGEVVRQVPALPEVAGIDAGLLVAGTAHVGGDSVDLAIEVLAGTGGWRPTLVSGTANGGIVLAEKAARDLDVRAGDTVRVEHPQLSATGLRTTRTPMHVGGVHPNPMRMLAYLDGDAATALGLAGSTNLLTVVPAAGVTPEAVRRALLAVPHVAAAQIAHAATEGMRESLDEYVGILRVAAVITLLLALLIAFNTTAISVDERGREHATMFAFGLSPGTVLGMTVVETVLIGAAGTAAGVAGGYGLLRWLCATTIRTVMPEIGVTAALSTATVAQALVLGVVTVALAPLLALRRTRRMDIPSTLRVME